jgi:adenosine kinase
VNDYEWSLTLEKSGWSEDEIAVACDAVVITLGERGSEIRQGEERIEIPPVAANKIVDPTACGDAFRAGLLYGRARGLPFEIAGRIGSLVGSYQVEVAGTQQLTLDMAAFRARFEREFDATF